MCLLRHSWRTSRVFVPRSPRRLTALHLIKYSFLFYLNLCYRLKSSAQVQVRAQLHLRLFCRILFFRFYCLLLLQVVFFLVASLFASGGGNKTAVSFSTFGYFSFEFFPPFRNLEGISVILMYPLVTPVYCPTRSC